jgi:RNA polymerase-binding transcription factor DksA
MNKKPFTDIPAEEWEAVNCAEELAEERKADSKERGRASNFAMAFISLLEAGGVSRDVFPAVHIFLSKTKKHAPDESVSFFSERDAGALLPGDPDVAYESLRKRYVRAWGLIEHEQARTGKRFCGRREKGSIQLASRKASEQKKGPKYFSDIAQGVVDVERTAARLRGGREDRFRRAGVEVWANLPVFTEADITIHPEQPRELVSEKGDDAEPKYPRRLDRFVRSAKEMLTEAKKRDAGAVEAAGRELVLELGKLLAEVLDVETESAFSLLADTLTEAADTPVVSYEDSSLDNTTVQSVDEKVGGTNFFEDPQISEQKRENDPSHVYGAVHVETVLAGLRLAPNKEEFERLTEQARTLGATEEDIDAAVRESVRVEPDSSPGNCVACGAAIHPERLEFDTELCDECGPSRYKGKPTAFRLIDEHERRKSSQGDVLYAEDFTT